jgi:PleD family two-component response regulator
LLVGLLGRVQALGIEHADSACSSSLTVSLGALSLMPRDLDGQQGALEQVDKLLYEAKAGGRHHGVHLDLVSGAKGRVDPQGPT